MTKDTINIQPKVSNIPNLVGYELSKIFVQNVSKQYLGDATLQSGVLKFVSGMAIDKIVPSSKGMTGKAKDYLVAGFVLDGIEDLGIGVYNMITAGTINIPFVNNQTPKNNEFNFDYVI
jgi:hypothetical protein